MTVVRSWLPALLLLAHCGGSDAPRVSAPTDGDQGGASGAAGMAGGAGQAGGGGQGGTGGAEAGQGGGGMAPVPQGGGSKKGNPFDFNADGFADVAVASPETGEVYLYFGSAQGLAPSPAVTLTGIAGGLFGLSMAQAGDVNADGFADLIVGAGETNEARVYLGNAQGIAETAIKVQGYEQSVVGASVAGIGDIDHDGFDDVFITLGHNSTRLYLGGPQGVDSSQYAAYGPAWYIGGHSVAGAGDVNGDGFADLIVGADHMVSLYTGSPSGLLAQDAPPLTFSPGSAIQLAVAGAGDVNGDGFDDVLVGDVELSQTHVLLGTKQGLPSAPSVTLQGPQGAFFGGAVASAGDVNGDGFADILVGAQGANRVYLYLGSPLGMDAEPSAALQGPDLSAFGQWVSTARDVNGDGFDDVIIGSPGSNQAFVYLGSKEGLATTPATTLTGPASGLFGYVVALVAAAPAAPLG